MPYRATRDGFRAAGTAERTFTAARPVASPAPLEPARADLFDVTPTDDQQTLQEDAARVRRRPPPARRALAGG